ncbi:hypothetical protein ALC56_06960 [Trachymyrmex septentrionalis]|uniref:Uncharacterized protein n=1 Tax=Trachymyrmex septentrionalis TaxID=34720 RepID=A0A151JX83_9HYME|nr:hypothetical protein ALC56_06960 [Trachymyrmex septentrionalis]
MKTIQIALAPLLIIGSFCSLGSFEYFLAQSKRYLSYLYVFAIWNFYVYFIYRCHSITLADYTLHQIIIHIIVLIAIPISFFHSKVRVLKYIPINNTVAILHELSTYNSDMALHEQILQFILQIKQREVKFGMGLVYFGYDFILKVCFIWNKCAYIYKHVIEHKYVYIYFFKLRKYLNGSILFKLFLN